MSERLEDNSEKKYINAAIEDLLPRYYETHGTELKYEIERMIPIDGHEVAWLKYTGQTHDGQAFEDHGLACACKFVEGIGWGTDDENRIVSFGAEDDCLPRKVALYLRQQELREEYIDRYKDSAIWGNESALRERVPEVILDLIAKDKAGEFIGEGTNGAHFWGGHLYVQTAAAITGKPMQKIWVDIHAMVANKQIQLEGCVIQEYYEAPEPSWTEYSRIEYEGYTGIAYLPAHSKMPQNWQIAILAQNGRLIREGIEGPRLMFSPDFGADESDIASVEASIKEVIDGYLWDPMSQA